jgi:signal transduction histidine kinase
MRPGTSPSPDLVVRALRHEVGDLLQSVYAAVGLVLERLPPADSDDRRVLERLRQRAELCGYELDAAHDLVCPLPLAAEPFDLAELSAGLVEVFVPRFPGLVVRAEANGPVEVAADRDRLRPLGALLLLNACQAARREARVRCRRLGGDVEWSFTDDGPGPTPEQLAWFERPFPATAQARVGLGLALARRLAELHGGAAAVEALPGGGSRVRLLLPTRPD